MRYSVSIILSPVAVLDESHSLMPLAGCDILTEMHKSGELEKTFGHMPPAAAAAVGSEKKA
jgi:hypothetical protein